MRPGKLWILVVSSTGQLQLHSPAISSILFSEVLVTATATAKSLQSCPTLCDPINSSLPGSPISGILQARTLEWIAISFSNAWQWKVKVKSLSRVRLLATPWTAAYQAPPPMGFSRQEYWSGVPLPSPTSHLCLFKFLYSLTFYSSAALLFFRKQTNKQNKPSWGPNKHTLTLTAREGNGTPLQSSCLENPMDGGAWWAAVHGVTKSWTIKKAEC